MSKVAKHKISLGFIRKEKSLETMQKVIHHLIIMCSVVREFLRPALTDPLCIAVKASMLQEFDHFSPGVLEIIRSVSL